MSSGFRVNKKRQRELGFGTKSSENVQRAIRRDGTFNALRSGDGIFGSFDLYHWLISIKWSHFILVVFLWYFLVNLLFAELFYFAGTDGIAGMNIENGNDHFWEVFFFSSQTLTTLGYGRMAPVNEVVSTLAAVESLIGLMGFALITGLLYGRFSRPVAHIIYSSIGVVAPYREGTGFMMRIVNGKRGNLLEPEAEIVLNMKAKNGQGRIFESLTLERTSINFLPLNWTIVHPIDESSPLYGMSEKEFLSSDAEFIVLVKAFDETFAQTVYSRTSYTPGEVRWGHKFLSMIRISENGQRVLEIDKIDDTEKVQLPEPAFA